MLIRTGVYPNKSVVEIAFLDESEPSYGGGSISIHLSEKDSISELKKEAFAQARILLEAVIKSLPE